MTTKRIERLVLFSCIIALTALPLMFWSLVDPRPLPIIVAMSIAQGLGTLSLALYVLAILIDLRQARIIGARSIPPPSAAPSAPPPQ